MLNTSIKCEGCLSGVFRFLVFFAHLMEFVSFFSPSPVLMFSVVPSYILNVVISAHISADWGDFPVGPRGVRFLLLLLQPEVEDVADRMILRRSIYFVVLHACA